MDGIKTLLARGAIALGLHKPPIAPKIKDIAIITKHRIKERTKNYHGNNGSTTGQDRDLVGDSTSHDKDPDKE